MASPERTEQLWDDASALVRQAGLDEQFKAAFDGRYLDRGRTEREAFERALAEGRPTALATVAANLLARERPSFRTNKVYEVPNPDEGVISLARLPQEGEDVPLLSLVNLTGEHKTVRLSLEDLKAKLGWDRVDPAKLHDIVSPVMHGQERPVQTRVEGGELVVELEPFAFPQLEARA